MVAGQDVALDTLHQCHADRMALDRGAAAYASASGGGSLVGRGTIVDAVAQPQISTSVRNGATIQAAGNVVVHFRVTDRGQRRWDRQVRRFHRSGCHRVECQCRCSRQHLDWRGCAAYSRQNSHCWRIPSHGRRTRHRWKRRMMISPRPQRMYRSTIQPPARSGTVRALWPGLCCQSWPRWRPRHTRTATWMRAGRRRRQRCHHYFYRFDDDDPWGGCVAS